MTERTPFLMTIYLCREGHKHHSQEAATHCGYCRRNNTRRMEANRNRDITLNSLKKPHRGITLDQLCAGLNDREEELSLLLRQLEIAKDTGLSKGANAIRRRIKSLKKQMETLKSRIRYRKRLSPPQSSCSTCSLWSHYYPRLSRHP